MASSLRDLSYPEVRARADELAARVLQEHWPERTAPVDPVLIARRLGVEVYSAQLGNDVYGLIVGGADGAEIFVDRDQPPTRWRFTAAHELGHYIEHAERPDDDLDYVDRRSDADPADKHEVFANQFAGALLMPPDLVREAEATAQGDVTLAARFAVSLQAWRIRKGRTPS